MNHVNMQQPISTSRHRLTADFGLTKFQRILWMLYNVANNALPNAAIDPRIQKRDFRIDEAKLDTLWPEVAATASPPRRLCDLFWLTLPWNKIIEEIGSARILEIGCGTGIYGRLLQKCLGSDFEHYLGVDIEADDSWEAAALDKKFAFEVGRASAADQFMAGRNLILTQSALEHFENDLTYFKKVADFVSASSKPTLQMHLVPTASCLLMFPWHGVRDYTPRTVSKISRLFDDKTRTYLFSLGGENCNRVHRQFITWPNYRYRVDMRHKTNDKYQDALRAAILADGKGDIRKPSFYAIVLASNFKQEIF